MKLLIYRANNRSNKMLLHTFEYPCIDFQYPVFRFFPKQHCSLNDMVGCYHLNAGDIAELEK